MSEQPETIQQIARNAYHEAELRLPGATWKEKADAVAVAVLTEAIKRMVINQDTCWPPSEILSRMLPLSALAGSSPASSNIVQVPDVPGPDGVCFKQAPTMERCLFKAGHDGPHQWASPAPEPETCTDGYCRHCGAIALTGSDYCEDHIDFLQRPKLPIRDAEPRGDVLRELAEAHRQLVDRYSAKVYEGYPQSTRAVDAEIASALRNAQTFIRTGVKPANSPSERPIPLAIPEARAPRQRVIKAGWEGVAASDPKAEGCSVDGYLAAACEALLIAKERYAAMTANADLEDVVDDLLTALSHGDEE